MRFIIFYTLITAAAASTSVKKLNSPHAFVVLPMLK